MSLKTIRRWSVSLFFLGLLGPGMAEAGPFLGNGWWWEQHFEAEGYSPLHYWLPGIYRCRAYHHPVVFDTPAPPYPPTPVGGQPYPFRDLPPVMPTPNEVIPPVMPPAGNGFVEPLPPPIRSVNPGK